MYKKTILILLLLFPILAFSQLPTNLERQEILDLGSGSRPLTIRHSGDGTGRLFIAEQDGKIYIYNGTTVLTTPFLDIDSIVNSSGNEQGLLGLDFDPNYATNGYFYVSYNNSSNDSIIARYSVSSGDVNIADSTSAEILLRVDQPRTNHNGGNILFGPDGYLYFGLGDGGKQGDPDNNAQSLDRLLGKMLRIDVNPDIVFKSSLEQDNRCALDAGNYYIPDDNPFNATNQCSEIWIYGFRNPWRWSFDKLTGDMIIGDVGQGTYEEVSFLPASSTGGENFGWRCREGAHDFDTSQCDAGLDLEEPVIDLPQSDNNGCSVMGGYVYRGPITAIEGMYVFSDYCGGEINFATPGGATWSFTMLENVGFGTYSFGEDEDGNVYVAINSKVFKFVLN